MPPVQNYGVEIPSLQSKIDVHHHFIPDAYRRAVEEAGGDPSGRPLPAWSVNSSLSIMKATGTVFAILSVTTPGPDIAGSIQKSRDLALACNQAAAKIRDENPDRFGFFAAVSTLLDTDGALAEINHAFDVLGADGVTLMTHYTDYQGNALYLGDPRFISVWTALDARQAVVFVHPTYTADYEPPTPGFGQALIEIPQDTTRTAFDMIWRNTTRMFPNVKIILSHLGGSLAFLLPRVAALGPVVANQSLPVKTSAEIMEGFKTFWFDTALSANEVNLQSVIANAGSEKILFGTDYPYGSIPVVTQFANNLDNLKVNATAKNNMEFGNALKLLSPGLAEAK